MLRFQQYKVDNNLLNDNIYFINVIFGCQVFAELIALASTKALFLNMYRYIGCMQIHNETMPKLMV